MNAIVKQLAAPGTTRQPTKLDIYMGQVLPPDRRADLARALPAHVPMARFERNLSNVLMQTPDLMNCPPALVYREVSKIAALGLYCDPALGEAYLITGWNAREKRKEPQIRIGYRGLLKLARQSGEIASIYAHEVHQNDEIECHLGAEKRLIHKPNLFGERGPVVGYYAVVKYKSGESDFEPMTLEQIYKIRDRSDGWKAFKADKIRSTPWGTDEEEMAKKTALRRLCKRIPQSPDLADAWKLEDAAEAPMVDVTPEKPRLSASEALAQIADDEEKPDAPEDAGVSDIQEIGGDGANDAPAGNDAISHPASPQPEAPALDFGGPPATEPMSEEDLDMAAQAITRQFASFKRPAAIDSYLATDKREVLERIEAQAPELAKFIRSKADAAKKALAR